MANPGTVAGRERRAGINVEELAALLSLDAVRGFGPSSFRAVHDAGVRPQQLLDDPASLPLTGKRGDTLREAIAALNKADLDLAGERAERQITRAAELGVRIVTYSDDGYPPNLRESNNPLPILYIRGDASVLESDMVVACVGSRKIRPPYNSYQARFAEIAANAGWVIASGFANGADTIAHRAAVDAGGKTLVVMPSGADIPFPPENRELWKDWLDHPGVTLLSEFPLGTKASSLTLRKRNKTIVGVSRGVLVGQTSQKGGTMNAYRFAREQRKPVFAFPADQRPDTSGNRRIEDENSEQLVLTHPDNYDSDTDLLMRSWLEQTLSSST